jgi:hypothetical protein
MSIFAIRKFLTVVFFGGVLFAAFSEERLSANSIYVEGLGPGLLYSFNYERLVVPDCGVRLGMSYSSFSATAASTQGTSTASVAFMTFPITASYLGISGGSHVLELGGGMTLAYASGSAEGVGMSSSASGMGVLGNVLVGYRIHPRNGGFQFRTGFAGLIGQGLGFKVDDPKATGFLPWFYISLGGCFR